MDKQEIEKLKQANAVKVPRQKTCKRKNFETTLGWLFSVSSCQHFFSFFFILELTGFTEYLYTFELEKFLEAWNGSVVRHCYE